MSTESRARIAIFMPSMQVGGAEKSMMLLANGIVGRGHAVDLVLARAEGPWLKHLDPSVRVVDLGASRTSFALPGLVRYLRRARPHAILSAMTHANAVAVLARDLGQRRARAIVCVRASIAPGATRSALDRLRRAAAAIAYRRADRIVANTAAVARHFCAVRRIPLERVDVIYNPVIHPGLAAKAVEPAPLLDGLRGRPLILSVGRLEPVKDFATLLRAFAAVRASRPARLLVLGDGSERGRLEALARELGIAADLLLPGFVENPLPYMKACSAFVLSSVREGFGNAMVEAMAMGAPIVATATEGATEVLDGGKWGLLAPVGDVEAMSRAIVAALDGAAPDPRPRAEEFTLARSVDAYLELALPRAAAG